MRTAYIALALTLLASHADAALIRIGGNFNLNSHPDAKLIFTGGDSNITGENFFLEQLPLNERHEFTVPADKLYWVQVFNQRYYYEDESELAQQWHFGYWLSGEPNAYQNATTIEMIAGDIIDVGGHPYQEWTYIVDGGTPENVQVRMIPEPASRGLVCLAALLAFAARQR